MTETLNEEFLSQVFHAVKRLQMLHSRYRSLVSLKSKIESAEFLSMELLIDDELYQPIQFDAEEGTNENAEKRDPIQVWQTSTQGRFSEMRIFKQSLLEAIEIEALDIKEELEEFAVIKEEENK